MLMLKLMHVFENCRFKIKSKNKFSKNRGQGIGCGNHGMSNEGVKYFKLQQVAAKSMNKHELCGIMLKWDEWTEENNFKLEHKKRTREAEEVETDKRESDVNGKMVLPGEEGHVEFSGWKDIEEEELDVAGDGSWGGFDGDGESARDIGRRIKRPRVSLSLEREATDNTGEHKQDGDTSDSDLSNNKDEDKDEDEDDDDGEGSDDDDFGNWAKKRQTV